MLGARRGGVITAQLVIIGFDARAQLILRFRAQTIRIADEIHQVMIIIPPEITADLDELLAVELVEEVASFPSGEHDDLVDSMSQAIMRFRRGGFQVSSGM